jgi:hypothetical protein
MRASQSMLHIEVGAVEATRNAEFDQCMPNSRRAERVGAIEDESIREKRHSKNESRR